MRLTENFRFKNQNLFLIFVDLEKAFDGVPRELFDILESGRVSQNIY